MTETLARLLLRLSEAGEPAILWGRQAGPHAGRGFERLLDRGVLVEQAPATDWDVCPDCDCGRDARPIQQINGRHIAACPIDRRSDVVLGDDDLRSFRIAPAALVREIAVASGFSGDPSRIAKGVWHLGQTPGQRALFLALSQDWALQSGLISLMRSASRSLPITVIGPELSASNVASLAGSGIAATSTAECFGDDADVGSFGIDLQALEHPPSPEPSLVILRQSHRVILSGGEIEIPQQPFKLLVMLAEAVGRQPGYLTPQQIEAENSGRGAADLVRDLRGALGHQRRQLIKTRFSPTGYFLALPAGAFALRS